MEVAKIVLLAIVAAVLYGIVQDLITTRVCLEYFTIGHPPVFTTQSPTLLALGWGVIATWWMGLPLGAVLACAARAGKRERWTAAQCVRPLAAVLGCMALGATIAGVTGYVLARGGAIALVEPLASRVPPQQHARFLADGWAHAAAYALGVLATGAASVWIARRRARASAAVRT